MRLVIAAVGQRQPAWARHAYDEFAKRFPTDCRLELIEVKAEPRNSGKTAAQMMAAEAARLSAATPQRARRVTLDERGTRLTTAQLAARLSAWRDDGRDVVLWIGGAARLSAWRDDGRDVVLWIGGPDGLDAALRSSADESLRLSDLTLPHALARVLLAEALYRASSLLAGHPYHRE